MLQFRPITLSKTLTCQVTISTQTPYNGTVCDVAVTRAFNVRIRLHVDYSSGMTAMYPLRDCVCAWYDGLYGEQDAYMAFGGRVCALKVLCGIWDDGV
jgi:hypothetical protein